MFEKSWERLTTGEKDTFRRLVNSLLGHTFLTAEQYDFEEGMTRINKDYLFVERHFELFREYLDYAGKNGMERLVDLYWMKNAFAADYMAERMAAAGFTDGYLTCADGFTRSLGGSDVSISGTLYDRVGKNIYKAAVADFGKVKSVVVFHDFPEGRQNAGFYYQFADGEMITPYVDPSDGLCKNSVSCLSVCSDSLSCAQVMLAAKSAYIADEFHPSQLREELADEGAFVFGRDACLYVSSDRIAVSDLLNDGSIEYSLEILK